MSFVPLKFIMFKRNKKRKFIILHYLTIYRNIDVQSIIRVGMVSNSFTKRFLYFHSSFNCPAENI